MKFKRSYQTYFRYYKKIGPLFKKPRVKAYTMLILSFFTMSFFGLFAVKPTLTTIAGLQKKIDDSRSVDDTLERKIINLSQLKEEYQKIEEGLPLIAKALPSDPNVSLFLREFEDLALETGVTISGVKVGSINLTRQDRDSSLKTPCSLVISGKYQASKNFLNRLLKSSRLYTIDSFKIDSSTKKKESTIKLDLKFDTHYLRS